MKTWYHVLRHPQTTNEKRANAAYLVDEEIQASGVKARLRDRKSRKRLASRHEDKCVAAAQNKYYRKQTHSIARKAKELEKGRLLAA